MDYDLLVGKVISRHKESPIDMLGIGDASGEFRYMSNLKPSYVRTIRDVDRLFKTERSNIKILEIGSFLGVVSVSLKQMGYHVCALDIPEFHQSDRLRSLYEQNEIPFSGINLRGCKLPFESGCFDAVIICEVMEHLNFNPLPVLQEINRVLKHDGYIYIGMPNQSRLGNRLKALRGKSIHNEIGDFFKQLDRSDNMIVGLHWREYTLSETVELIQKMGFKISKKYFFEPASQNKERAIKKILMRTASSFPPFRSFHVVMGKKVSVPSYEFWLTEANS